MQNARHSVVNSTTRADKHSGVADREMGLGVSTPLGSHIDEGVPLSQSSGSSIDSDHSSKLWPRENECMTESDDDNSDEDIDSKALGDGSSSWDTNNWFRDIGEVTDFLNLSNDYLKDISDDRLKEMSSDSLKSLQDQRFSQVVDTLQNFLCNTHPKFENGCHEVQDKKSGRSRTIFLLKNYVKRACDEKNIDAIELVWQHLTKDHETKEDLLFKAAERGLVSLCECLIEKKTEVNEKHQNKFTPLMGASRSGHLDVVRFLCENQGDLSIKGEDGETALHIACKVGHEEIARFLVHQGAGLEEINKTGYTPLMEAVSEGHIDVVTSLLRLGANSQHQVEGSKETPLLLAASKGHLEMVKFFVKHCTRVHACQLHNALMKASMHGQVGVGSYLIEIGVQVHKQKNYSESPLTLAAREGHKKFVELLLSHGANIEEANEDGFTPLIGAASRNHIRLAEYLISENANLNAMTTSGEDALMQASRHGHLQMIELLLKLDAPVDRETESGRTALLFATKYCHPLAVQLLIGKGADVNKATRNNDETILSAACHSGNLDVVQLLLQHGADPHCRLQDGSTMLIEAVRGGHSEMVKMLINLTTRVSSSCSSQVENEDYGSGGLDEMEYSSDIQQQNRSPSVPQLNVSPTHSILSNDIAMMATEDEEAFGMKADSCSEESDTADDEMCKKIITPLFKKSIQLQQCPHSKLKIDQFKKQCLRHIHPRHRRSSLSTESTPNNWKNIVAASQASQKVEKRLRSTLTSSPKSVLVDQKLYKSSSACEACGCCPATSVEELDKKSLQMIQKSFFKASNVDHQDKFDGHMDKFSCPSCVISPQDKIPPNNFVRIVQSTNQCQDLCSATTQKHLMDSLQDHPHDSSLRSSKQPLFNIEAQVEGSQETPLIIACSNGYMNVAKMLLQNHAKVEHRDKKGFTALLHAASAGHDTIVELLLNVKANTEAVFEKTKDTALSMACVNGHLKVIDLLLSKGANKEHRNVSDYSPLGQAASVGNLEAVELMLHHGAEINSRTNNKAGITPLMLASMHGQYHAVKLLLDRGSDVNAIMDTNKETALTMASLNGHYEVVRLLLDNKANMEHRAKVGSTALMEAAQNGHLEVGKLLLDRGADIGSFRDTALGIASEKGHCKFVEFLLARHAPIDIKNRKGTSPLWMACYAGHIEVIKALVLSGADADATDSRKVSCLVAALRKGHVNVVKFLVNHVSQFPPDPECQKFQNSAEETENPESASRFLECLEIIKKAKEAQEMKAYKNAAILLDELQQEKKLEDKKKAAKEKKREKKKQKKKEKVALTAKNLELDQKNSDSKHVSGSPASDEESSQRSASDEEVVEKENNPGKILEQLTGMKKKAGQRDLPESIEQISPLKDFVCPSVNASGMPLQESKTRVNNKCQELIKTETSYIKSKLSSIGDLDDFGLLPQTNVVVAPVLVSTPNLQKIKSEHKVTPKVNSEPRESSQPKVAPSSTTRTPSQASTPITKTVTIVTTTHTPIGSYKPTLMTMNSTASNLKTFTKKKITSLSQATLKKDEPQTFFLNSKDSLKKMKKIDVPARAVSRVIGRAGCNINAIREFSGAKIDLDKVKYSDDAVVTIRGANDGVNKASELIQSLIRESDKDIEQLIATYKHQQSSGTVSSLSGEAPVATNAWKTGSTPLMLKNSPAIPSSYSSVQAIPSMAPTSNVWENRKIQADQNKASTNAWLKPQSANKDCIKSCTTPSSNIWDNSMADGVGKASAEPQSNDVVDEKPEPITTFPIGAWKSVSKACRERSPNSITLPDNVETVPVSSQMSSSKENSDWFQTNSTTQTLINNISPISAPITVSSNSYLSFGSTIDQPSTPTYSNITGSRSMTGEYSPFGATIFGSSIYGNQTCSQVNPIGSSSDISAHKSKAPGYRPPSFMPRSQTPPTLATFQTRPDSLQAFNIDLNHSFEAQKYLELDPIGHNNLVMLLQSPKEKVQGHDPNGQDPNTPSSHALPMKIISTLNPNAPNFHSRPMSPQNILKSHMSSSIYKSSVNMASENHNLPKLLQSYQISSSTEASSPYKVTYGGDLGMVFPPQLSNQQLYEYSSQRFPVGDEAINSNGIGDASGCDGRMREGDALHQFASMMRSSEPRKQTRLQPIGTERNSKKQLIMNPSSLPPSSQNQTSNPSMMINLQQGIGNWPFSHATSSLFRSPSTNPTQDSSHVIERNVFPQAQSSFNLDPGFRGHAMPHHVPSLFDSSATNNMMQPLGGYVMPNGSATTSTNYPERVTPQHFQQPNSNPMYFQQSSFARIPQDLDNWQLNQVPSMDVNDSQLWGGMWHERN